MVPPDHLKQKIGPPRPTVAAALGPLLPYSVPLFSTYINEAAQHKNPATNYMSSYASLLPTVHVHALLQNTTAHGVDKASSTSHTASHFHVTNYNLCLYSVPISHNPKH